MEWIETKLCFNFVFYLFYFFIISELGEALVRLVEMEVEENLF